MTCETWEYTEPRENNAAMTGKFSYTVFYQFGVVNTEIMLP